MALQYCFCTTYLHLIGALKDPALLGQGQVTTSESKAINIKKMRVHLKSLKGKFNLKHQDDVFSYLELWNSVFAYWIA